MKKNVKGLDGKEYKFSLGKYKQVYNEEQRRSRSKYHVSARQTINSVYPGYIILEEIKLPGTGNLFLDFFLPKLDLAIEVHGQQHYEFTPFFHKTKLEFLKSKSRDNKKEEWCKINDIELVILKYSENTDEWARRIQNR